MHENGRTGAASGVLFVPRYKFDVFQIMSVNFRTAKNFSKATEGIKTDIIAKSNEWIDEYIRMKYLASNRSFEIPFISTTPKKK